TRTCGYCAGAHGKPVWEDREEPERIGRAVGDLGLEHIVITSVNRDDLADGGAAHWAATVHAVRRHAPRCRIEVLIPDFQGSPASLDTVIAAGPDILNHNTETVPRLYKVGRRGTCRSRGTITPTSSPSWPRSAASSASVTSSPARSSAAPITPSARPSTHDVRADAHGLRHLGAGRRRARAPPEPDRAAAAHA